MTPDPFPQEPGGLKPYRQTSVFPGIGKLELVHVPQTYGDFHSITIVFSGWMIMAFLEIAPLPPEASIAGSAHGDVFRFARFIDQNGNLTGSGRPLLSKTLDSQFDFRNALKSGMGISDQQNDIIGSASDLRVLGFTNAWALIDSEVGLPYGSGIQELARCWRDLNLTVEEGLDELKSLCAQVIVRGRSAIHNVPRPRPSVQRLLDAAEVTLPKAIADSGVRVSTRKKLRKEH